MFLGNMTPFFEILHSRFFSVSWYSKIVFKTQQIYKKENFRRISQQMSKGNFSKIYIFFQLKYDTINSGQQNLAKKLLFFSLAH